MGSRSAALTLEEELKLVNKPIWQEEEFESQKQYEDWYVRLVEDLRSEARNAWRGTKERWMDVDKRIEMIGSVKQSPSQSDTSFVQQAMEEFVALALENQPRPKTASRTSETQDMCGQINAAIDQELDANEFESVVMPKTLYNTLKFHCGVQKVIWDSDEPGQFGNEGRNKVLNIDTRFMHVDPFAKGYRRSQMRYLIEDCVMDLSEVRRRWPHKNVEPDTNGNISPNRYGSDVADLPLKAGGDGEYTIGVRHRVVVKECWINSDRMWHEPQRDKDGNFIRNSDGEIITEWKKKYPYGRHLVVANGKLLVDQPNPFNHGEFPYVFYPLRVCDKIFSYGIAEPLLCISDKLNRLTKDMMANLRVSMNTPWVIDRHAFDTAQKFRMLTHEPGLILPVATGAKVERLQAGELPQSVFVFVEYLRGVFDDIIGIQGVSRGQTQKGSQMSADAISQLQQSATARVRLKARLMETSLRQLGFMLQYNIRQFYDSDFKVAVVKPGSEDKVLVEWNSKLDKGNYSLDIEVGSSLPGAKEAGTALFMKLFEKGILPREWTIRMLEIPGGEKIIEDIREREDELAQLQARSAAGLREVMQRRYNGQGGAREKAPTL